MLSPERSVTSQEKEWRHCDIQTLFNMPCPGSNILVSHSCEICGSHSSVAEDLSLRVYDVLLGV
jgi:hypothetical protein